MRASFAITFSHIVGLVNSIAEELHLAPQIVVQAPADEILARLVPFVIVGHEEHTGFQVGNHIGAEREVLVSAALAQATELRTFLVQLLG